MFNLLEGAPGRVVVDANILLNATFVPASLANQALHALSTLGYQAVVDESVLNEAHDVVRRLVERYALGIDPLPAIRRRMPSARTTAASPSFLKAVIACSKPRRSTRVL
jgi:hypothetical protein